MIQRCKMCGKETDGNYNGIPICFEHYMDGTLKEWMVFEACNESHCSGFKSQDECPHNGIFDKNNKDCIECTNDAISAMEE